MFTLPYVKIHGGLRSAVLCVFGNSVLRVMSCFCLKVYLGSLVFEIYRQIFVISFLTGT